MEGKARRDSTCKFELNACVSVGVEGFGGGRLGKGRGVWASWDTFLISGGEAM